MMLSRRAVRPAQTRHLLRQGFLPVSIDYRLCPEINLIDGPITDVCDAYGWARTMLPEVAAAEGGVQLDPERVAVMGWSTGGHLAMSLAWTAEAAGMPPPNAVLSFYAPVDFSSGGKCSEQRCFSLPSPVSMLGSPSSGSHYLPLIPIALQSSILHLLSSCPIRR